METNDPVLAQQPVVADEKNTKTVFSISSLTLPTPDKIKAIFKAITFSIWVIAFAANTFLTTDIPTKMKVLEITGFLTLVLQKAEDFWGIKITN